MKRIYFFFLCFLSFLGFAISFLLYESSKTQQHFNQIVKQPKQDKSSYKKAILELDKLKDSFWVRNSAKATLSIYQNELNELQEKEHQIQLSQKWNQLSKKPSLAPKVERNKTKKALTQTLQPQIAYLNLAQILPKEQKCEESFQKEIQNILQLLNSIIDKANISISKKDWKEIERITNYVNIIKIWLCHKIEETSNNFYKKTYQRIKKAFEQLQDLLIKQETLFPEEYRIEQERRHLKPLFSGIG